MHSLNEKLAESFDPHEAKHVRNSQSNIVLAMEAGSGILTHTAHQRHQVSAELPLALEQVPHLPN